MFGVVKQVGLGWALINSQEGVIFCHASRMPMDEVGRRYLLRGEEVEFDLIPRQRPGRHDSPWDAANVRLVNPREPVDAAAYFEEGTVHIAKPQGFCHILRPYGGSAFLHFENVINHAARGKRVQFWPGQVWRYQLEAPEAVGKSWRAVNAEEITA